MKLTVVFEDGTNIVGKNEEGTLFTKVEDAALGHFIAISSYTVRRENGNEIMDGFEPLDIGDTCLRNLS